MFSYLNLNLKVNKNVSIIVQKNRAIVVIHWFNSFTRNLYDLSLSYAQIMEIPRIYKSTKLHNCDR